MGKLKFKERSYVQSLSPIGGTQSPQDSADQAGAKFLKLSTVKDTVVHDKCKVYEVPRWQTNQGIYMVTSAIKHHFENMCTLASIFANSQMYKGLRDEV